MAEDNKEKLHIRLHVYDTEMSVMVPREEEPLYRDAAVLITNTVNAYARSLMVIKVIRNCFIWLLLILL